MAEIHVWSMLFTILTLSTNDAMLAPMPMRASEKTAMSERRCLADSLSPTMMGSGRIKMYKSSKTLRADCVSHQRSGISARPSRMAVHCSPARGVS